MATVAQLEAALMKADAAGDEAAAREIAAEIKRTRSRTIPPSTARRALDNAKADAQARLAQARRTNNKSAEQTYSREVARLNKMTPAQFYKAPGRIESFVGGFVEGVTKPIEVGLNVLGLGGDAGQRERGKFRLRESEKRFPMTTGAGKITGEIAATAPLIASGGGLITAGGARLATAAPRVAPVVQRFGQAVSSGGIGVQAPTRAGRVALRTAGGATAGAAGAALTGQDVTEGALFGAGIPVVGSVLKRLGGKAVDLARLPAVKAGQIIREALGKDVDAAKAAFSALSADDQRLAQQVLIDAGVEPSPFFGIGSIVAREIDPDTPAAILARQAAEREARMAGISGGETATARRGAIDVERRAVNELTGPARDEALARANIAGETVPAAEALAAAARQRADEITASGFVPRMRGLEERAGEQAAIMGGKPALFPDMERIQQTRGIAGAAGQRADEAMAAQIGLRDVARDMEDVVADLAAEGMTPLRVGPIVQQLRSMAGQPGTRADKLQRTTLTRLATELEGLADPSGVIDARDLYQIRKTGLNDIVDRLLGSRAQPSSGTKERTASLLTSLRPMIDDAIEGAGGTNWKDYLVRTRQGFEAVNRQELSARGAQLAKENPDEFIALMRGERPQIVEDIMGKGTKQYDIAGMALADPRRYTAMMQTADELQSLNRMREFATLGETAGGNLLTREQPGYLSRGIRGIVGAKFPAVAYAGQGLNQVQRAIMSPKVQQELAAAYQSGPAMAAAMNQFPTAVRMSEQVRQQLSPSSRNAIAQLLNQYLSQ
jgi:hypothetical protein